MESVPDYTDPEAEKWERYCRKWLDDTRCTYPRFTGIKRRLVGAWQHLVHGECFFMNPD